MKKTGMRAAPANSVMPRKITRYGWIPDLPDQRDFAYAAPRAALAALPPSMDLRPGCPPVYDQGQLGSCTANAIAAAIEFDQMKQKQAAPFVPSRLFVYYNERVIEGTIKQDAGAMIRDGVKSVNRLGAPPEPLWPYTIARFAQKPPTAAYKEASKHQVLSYQRVARDLAQMRGCLASGYPFVFGFTVYDSFESAAVAKSGVLNMPGGGEQTVGGHAVLAVGYTDAAQRFVVRNSWGPGWGQKGYFTIPYAYLMSATLASDFWTLTTVE
jgi:C1A family cysteine protease